MTTTDTTDPWCDENDTSIAVGDWVLVDDARGNPTIQRVDALVFDALGPHLRLHNDDDPPPGHVIRLDPFPADAEEPDWFHDSIGGRWIGPVGDGTIVVLDNAHGRGAMGTTGDDAEFWISAACPLHGALTDV